MDTQQSTELLIKDTAKKIFFVDGHINATTQEIADAAGVNRTLLNYYFRSRDALFNEVYEDTKQEKSKYFLKVLDSELPLKEKVEKIIDILQNYISRYPYAEVFLISEMNKKEKIDLPKASQKFAKTFQRFLDEADTEIKKGNLRAENAREFFINLISLISYPLMTKDLYSEIFNMKAPGFKTFNQKRKENIIKLFFTN